ncbi:SusC/RagA family TonB-linked outer membrane protein [Echinicola rosea]|uniref:SusC/RagA family TonB-linked outer membrane protein n=1 Tax=Echinicola rosea TaxID=1807691 RepID=UPI0010CA6979|nr:SusC/RagA family TonB-linked outer membrane protein [Echinicola rosea]
MMKNVLVFLCTFCLYGIVAGQTVPVTGTVTDADSGEPIPAANILIKGTAKGMVSDVDGSYRISVEAGQVLVFSFIGYDSREVVVGDQEEVNVALKSSASDLDEFVVVGYQSVVKRDVTGAVNNIQSEQLEAIPVTNVATLIGTQSTGIQSVNISGAAGARGALVIRGNTAVSSGLDGGERFTAFSSPLYVVDGVQTSLEDLAGYGVSNTDYLASLNPNDIESIDILKDASASAIYGSRGANGVIIIKTKRGQALDKPQFDFSTSIGFQPIPNLVPMLVGAAERREKMGMLEKWWDHEFLLSNQVPIMLTDSLNPAFNNNVDYQGLFYQKGVSQRYNLSMRGGSEETNYRLSFGYNDDKGVVKATGFTRYTLNAHVNTKVGKKFTNQFLVNTSFTENKTGQGNPGGGSFNLDNSLPTSPNSLNSSLFYLTEAKRKSLEGELDEKLNTDEQLKVTFSNFAQLKIIEGLKLNSQLTFQYDLNKKNFYEPSSIRPNGDGFAAYSLYTRKNHASDLYLDYFKTLGDHEVIAIVGNRVDYNKYEDMRMSAVGFGSDAIQVINNRYEKDNIDGYTDISENALLSYYARLSYKYKDKYLLSANFSTDGSSRFGKDVRWAKFGSLSAGWVISDEPFLKELAGHWLDFAKLRASWGRNGKQFSQNYLRFGAYSLGYGGTPSAGYNTNQMNVSSYGGVTGIIPNYGSIGNDKLSWEESEQWNIGFDIAMLDQRLNLTFDAYHKDTDQLFFDIDFPSYSGYNTAKANVAGVLNYGWEGQIRYDIFPRASHWKLQLTAGFAKNENYVSKLPNGNRDYLIGSYGYIVGRPLNLYNIFLNDYIIDNLEQLPVNPYTGEPLTGKSAWAAIRPGLPIWKDINGDYLLDEAGDQIMALEYSPVPDIQGNFNIDLRYKGWYLQAYSQFSFGADIMNTVLNSYMDRYDRGGTDWATFGLADLSEHTFWEKPGDGAAGVRFPALFPAGGGEPPFYAFRGNQSLWIESGDYWKITNASVGHMFNKDSFIKNLGLSRLRVYISVLNPYQWQKSKNVVDASMVDARGYVLGNGYPQAQTYFFGLDARF